MYFISIPGHWTTNRDKQTMALESSLHCVTELCQRHPPTPKAILGCWYVITAHKNKDSKRKKEASHIWTQRFRLRKINRGLVTLNVKSQNFKVRKNSTLWLFFIMTIHNTARNTGHNKANIVHNTGRWSKTEEDTFQNAMRLHGVGNWKAISLDVATRQEKGIMTLCTSFTYFLLILYQKLINFIDSLLMKNSSAVQCKTHNQKKQIKTEK